VLLSPSFIIEVLILLPAPFAQFRTAGVPEYFNMRTINWSGSHTCYQTYLMYTDDILFSLMFLRFFFMVQSLAAFAPTNKDLFGKRVCHEKQFEPNFTFQVMANMKRYKYLSIFLLSFFATAFFSCTVRIYERPYYQSVGQLDFSTLDSSIWLTIITMSSVGYGATYPST